MATKAPPLPPSSRDAKRKQETLQLAPTARFDERRPSDAATIDSGLENKRMSANLHQVRGPLMRISKKIQQTTKAIVGGGKQKPATTKAEPQDVPPPIPTIKARDDIAPVVSYQQPEKEAPPAPPRHREEPARTARKGIVSNVMSRAGGALSRLSLRTKKNPAQFDINRGLAVIAREKAAHELDENGQEVTELPTPKYSDLPSLLEFYVEYDEYDDRGQLIDDRYPKINPDTIIVMSFGEGTVQSGLASSDKGPDHVFPTLCGEPQSFNVRVMDKGEKNPIKFGQDAANRRGIYALEWFNDTENGPPKYTKVGDAMAYNSAHCLRRALKQDAIILPMHLDMDLERRLRLVCLAFERVGARAVRVISEEKAALHYVTKQSSPTGIVVDIGHSKTRCVAIVDGEIAEVSLQRTMACGKTMTLRMFNLLKQKTSLFEQNVTGMEFAREAKEKHAFALSHPPSDRDLCESPREFEQVFDLNDGQYVNLGHERYICAEALFQPEKDEGKLSYLKATSIQQAIVDCLKCNDRDIWRDLLKNVVIIGGAAQLPGLKHRLEAELYKLLPAAQFQHLNLVIEPFAGWHGARLASLKEGDVDHWISRREWRQGGETKVQERLESMAL